MKYLTIILAVATVIGTRSSFLRSTQEAPEYPCDDEVNTCIKSCKEMTLPFSTAHCSDLGLLACNEGQCAMSKMMAAKIMKEEKMHKSAQNNKRKTTILNSKTKVKGKAKTKGTASEVLAFKKKKEVGKVPQLKIGPKEPIKSRLERLEKMIQLKKGLGESPSPDEVKAVSNLRKLIVFENLERSEKKEIKETQDLLNKEESTEKNERAQLSAMRAQLLDGGNKMLKGIGI
jgi:hypothetical protein